jgi:anti-anti-sigma factor
VEILVIFGLVYTVVAYSVDLIFSLLGIISIRNQRKKFKLGQTESARFPSLNILIPCYNEEKTIQKGIRFLQEIDYPNLKVIIINDGSKDRTLDILREKLSVSEIPLQYQARIPTQTVKRIYRGADARFMVVDKVNGGKADTLNTGINLSDSELVCCVDADTLIKTDGLKKIVMPFLTDRRVVAAGGSVRIKNDSEDLNCFPNRLQSPYKLISTLQVIEYIRSINVARNSLSLLNANLIISGAFGVFKTGILKEIGGYEKFSKGEDLELLTRIHFHMLKTKKKYRIAQVYLADSFTNAPESFKELKSQRKRWQVGLVSTLRTHFFKFFRYPFAPITFFSLPYYILFEVISPIIQLLIILAIPILTILNLIHLNYVFFLLISMIYNALINIFFLLLDFFFSSYYGTADKLKLISTSLVEPFFYHQLNCYWKLLGTMDYMKKVFVRAAWTPPRGDKEYQSQLGKMSVFLNPESEKGLGMVADYKSLYRDHIVIIALSGSFEASDIVEFENLVKYFGQKKRKKIILELKELENISSDALSMLIQLSRKLKREKGGITVLNPQNKIEDEFKISNAVKEIKICKNYSNAIKEVKYG